MQRTPSSVAFCSVQSMRSPRDTACTSVMPSGDSRSAGGASPDPHAHAVAFDRDDLAAEVAAGAVEQRERRAGPQPQHARDVIGRRFRQRDLRAGRERLVGVDAVQSHVAASMPSRAVATSRSISSGVITYGGMK